MLEINKIYLSDCYEILDKIDSESVNLIAIDPPYNTTACSWETEIDLEKLWKEYKRILTPNGSLVSTAAQPFTSRFIYSNLEMFKYTLVWDKKKPSSALHAGIMPLRSHEDIIVFSKGKTIYHPQMSEVARRTYGQTFYKNGEAFGNEGIIRDFDNEGLAYPKSIITISNANQLGREHPTQKPVSLFSYLIKTYSNEGDLILDTFSGSGTTAIACLETKRNYICIEKDEGYYTKSLDRIAKWREDQKTIFDLF